MSLGAKPNRMAIEKLEKVFAKLNTWPDKSTFARNDTKYGISCCCCIMYVLTDDYKPRWSQLHMIGYFLMRWPNIGNFCIWSRFDYLRASVWRDPTPPSPKKNPKQQTANKKGKKAPKNTTTRTLKCLRDASLLFQWSKDTQTYLAPKHSPYLKHQ